MKFQEKSDRMQGIFFNFGENFSKRFRNFNKISLMSQKKILRENNDEISRLLRKLLINFKQNFKKLFVKL